MNIEELKDIKMVDMQNGLEIQAKEIKRLSIEVNRLTGQTKRLQKLLKPFMNKENYPDQLEQYSTGILYTFKFETRKLGNPWDYANYKLK